MAEYNERVASVAADILDAVTRRLVENRVSHDEYRAAWRWLSGLAGSGEVPLFLDVFFEATVERLSFDDRPGSQGSVEGPYHLEDAPLLTERPYVLPMRPGEPGTPLLFTGRVTDPAGSPLAGAEVDMWQAGNDGTYSGFVGDAPRTNLRGRMLTDDEGRFRVRTIRPAPYQIPNSGPTGEFLQLLGRHSWRPAHFHFIIGAIGHEPLTTQVYFRGDEWLDESTPGGGDVVGAVKDSLIVDIGQARDDHTAAEFGFTGPYATANYDFVLSPVR
ncbi:dioxygenase family protein [Amycolatopsis sp. NPDC004378]